MTLAKFNEVLESHGVRLTQEEIRRLVGMSRNPKNSGAWLDSSSNINEQNDNNLIDYKQLSKNMGLQRNALNLMHSTFNLEKSVGKVNMSRLLTK